MEAVGAFVQFAFQGLVIFTVTYLAISIVIGLYEEYRKEYMMRAAEELFIDDEKSGEWKRWVLNQQSEVERFIKQRAFYLSTVAVSFYGAYGLLRILIWLTR